MSKKKTYSVNEIYDLYGEGVDIRAVKALTKTQKSGTRHCIEKGESLVLLGKLEFNRVWVAIRNPGTRKAITVLFTEETANFKRWQVLGNEKVLRHKMMFHELRRDIAKEIIASAKKDESEDHIIKIDASKV